MEVGPLGDQTDFYTMKGYELNSDNTLTAGMEDYLEMIYRLSIEQNFVRMNDLAMHLHVKPSSATKMVHKLNSLGYVKYEKYKVILLTQDGEKAGAYLLHRHHILYELFCWLNNSQDELKQLAQIDHRSEEHTAELLSRISTSDEV